MPKAIKGLFWITALIWILGPNALARVNKDSILRINSQAIQLNIGQNKGLPSQVIYDIMQDASGIIWLCSNEGLLRYDGSKFRRYLPDVPSSLPGGNLKEDPYGRIWYQNFDGYCFYLEEDSLYRFNGHNPAGFQNFSLSEQHLYLIDQSGAVVAFELSNFNRVDSLIIDLRGFNDAAFWNGAYYLIENRKLWRWEINGVKTEFGLELPSAGDNYRLELHPQFLWLYEKFNRAPHYYSLDLAGDLAIFPQIRGPRQINRFHFKGDSLWLCSMEGLFTYYKNELIEYQDELIPSQVLHDRQGNRWVSSLDQGLVSYPQSASRFFPFPKLKATRMMKRYPHEGLVLSTRRGLYHFRPSSAGLELMKELDPAPGLFLFHDSVKNSLFYTSKETYFWSEWPRSPAQRLPFFIRSIARLDSQYYIFGTSQVLGIMRDPLARPGAKSSWDSLFNADKNEGDYAILVEGCRIRKIIFAPESGFAYVASNKGLFRIDQRGDSYYYKNKSQESLSVSELCQVADQLFALDYEGIVHKLQDSLTEIYRGSWRPSSVNRIFSLGDKLAILNDHKITVSYPTQAREDLSFPLLEDKEDVLDILPYEDALLVLLSNGILQIEPKLDFPSVPNDFILMSVKAKDKTLSLDRKAMLRHDENLLKFSFAYYSPWPSDLFYQLNEQGPLFPLNNSRQLILNALKSGDYKIDFFSADQTSSLGSYQFTIAAPFWLQHWFFAVVIALIGAISYYIFRRQVAALEYRNQMQTNQLLLEKERDRSTLSSIKAQMNPHFIFNALNTIQYFVFNNQREKAIRYLNKFSKLTRNILEMSERESLSIEEEVQALEVYLDLEKMRFPDQFSYHIELDSKLDKNWRIPAMMIQPYVENAIKHGLTHLKQERCLWVRFKEDLDYLAVEIEDNGIGRKRASEIQRKQNDRHRPFATRANLTRLEILNKGQKHKISLDYFDKTNSQGQATGTLLRLRIPIRS